MLYFNVPGLLALPHGWPSWMLAVGAAVLARVVFRRYWTSIRDVPGPFLASFSNLWQVWQILKGHTETETIQLHKKHGMHGRGSAETNFRIVMLIPPRLLRSHRAK